MEKKEHLEGDERLEVYEIGFHLVPIVSADALPAETNAIRSLIEANGGAIISEGAPSSRQLAYTLSRVRGGKREKFDHAYFGWVKYECPIESADAIKAGMDKNENVLRHLIIKTVRENTLVPAALIGALVGDTATRSPHVESHVETHAATAVSAHAADAEPKPEIKAPASVAVAEPKMSAEEMDKTIDEMVNE